MSSPFFHVPLDLPHACTVADRILNYLRQRLEGPGGNEPPYSELRERIGTLHLTLVPYKVMGENPEKVEAEEIRQEVAALLRLIVDDIARLNLGGDRLGQCVRNLFECLEMGQEGSEAGLRAGENPNSLQRPW